MCGIVTAIATQNVVPVLLEGLRKLEYRGYDSAGLAVLAGELTRLRSCGRVAELASLADARQLSAHIGIAHTRWATHVVPSERNAHPHISGGLAVVHNGIIENFEAIKTDLQGRGYVFESETDTEAIAHLVHFKLQGTPDLFEAVRQATNELVGAYAIGVVAEADPFRIIVARRGSPLLLGVAKLAGARTAGYWGSVLALAWFSHGIMVAWTRPPELGYALLETALALVIIFAANLPGLRGRLGGRKRG